MKTPRRKGFLKGGRPCGLERWLAKMQSEELGPQTSVSSWQQRYSPICVSVAGKAMEAMDTPPTCSDPLQNPLQITHPSSPLLQ